MCAAETRPEADRFHLLRFASAVAWLEAPAPASPGKSTKPSQTQPHPLAHTRKNILRLLRFATVPADAFQQIMRVLVVEDIGAAIAPF
jgi:hypothetical protein